MKLLELIIQLLIGLTTIIPLVIALITFVGKSIKEKNWSKMICLAMSFMQDAENKFDKGTDKENYVVSMVLKAAQEIDYNISEIELRNFIKNAIGLSKTVNTMNKKDNTHT